MWCLSWTAGVPLLSRASVILSSCVSLRRWCWGVCAISTDIALAGSLSHDLNPAHRDRRSQSPASYFPAVSLSYRGTIMHMPADGLYWLVLCQLDPDWS